MERLNKYGSWRISKYEQEWRNGEVVDDLFECSMRIDLDSWASFYGTTPRHAIDEALASPHEPKYLRSSNTCRWHAPEWYTPSEAKQIKEELKTAVKYLREGKAKFSPHTTNSDVDVFLEKYKDL